MDQFKEPGNIPPNQSLQSDTETVQSADQTNGSAEPLPHAKGLAVGDVVEGRYKILSVIGRGAVGCVYKVEKTALKQQYALKTLLSAVNSDVSLQRFQKEARAAGRLEHPNVVRAIDFGVMEGNQPFIVMDLVEGQTLTEYLKTCGRMTVEDALQIFIPICHGLAHAHNGGVIHRDIKPSNIVLVPSGTRESQFVPKIVDFGIAKVEFDHVRDEQKLTKAGEIFGTPLYMSPEQCAGLPVDDSSDIYSLGCVFFESLTGAPPFKGESALATMMKHQNERPLSLREASNGLDFSPGLEAVVAKMLAKESANRYSNCLRLAEDLTVLQRGEGLPTSDVSPAKSKAASTRSAIPVPYVYFLLIAVIASIAVLIYTSIGQSQRQKPVSATSTVNSGTAKPKETEPDQVSARFCTGDRSHGLTFHFGDQPVDPLFTFGSTISCSSPNEPRSTDQQRQSAKGKIRIPPGFYVEFQPSLEFTFGHPSLFRSFKPGDIQRLNFNYAEVAMAVLPVGSPSFDDAIAYVSHLKGLDALTFANVPLDADGLAKMKLDNMQDLTYLSLVSTTVDGIDLSRFTILGKLKDLEFSNGQNAAALLKTLKGLRNNSVRSSTAKSERKLILRGDKLTDNDLSIIGDCDCGDLNIRDNPDLTSAGLRQLLKQQQLKRLILDGQRFDPSVLKEIASKIHLGVLILGSVNWTEEDKEKFRRSLPHCLVDFGESSQKKGETKLSSALPEAAKEGEEIKKAQKNSEEGGEDKILTQRAQVYSSQGKYAEAEPLLKRALTISEKTPGANCTDLARSLDKLAFCYNHQKKYEEAEPLLERALEIREKVPGRNNADLANSLFYKAQCFVQQHQKRYKEAEPLFERALKVSEKALAPNHPDIVQFLYPLADCYEHQGRYKEAEPLLKRALKIKEKALGPSHPDMAESLTKLAECYDGQSRFEEEEAFLKRVIEIREKTPAHDPQDLAETLDAQANCYEHLGKHAEAEQAKIHASAVRSIKSP